MHPKAMLLMYAARAGGFVARRATTRPRSARTLCAAAFRPAATGALVDFWYGAAARSRAEEISRLPAASDVGR